MIHPDADLSDYKLVLVPNLVILSDDNAHKLNSFVEGGGVLFVDGRTGEKDEYNRIYERDSPGILSKSLGVKIEDVSCMYDDMSYPVTKDERFNNEVYTSHQYCEWVKATDAESVLLYDAWQMEGSSVLTKNNFGRGVAWYLSSVIKEPEFYDRLIQLLINEASITTIINDIPDGVEIVCRGDKNKKLYFLINHNDSEQSINLPFESVELISNKKMKGEVEIERFGVRVFKTGIILT